MLAIPGILNGMAKVMVSLPDDLLRVVDIEADRSGTTRSGYLRKLAEKELRLRTIGRAEKMAKLDKTKGSSTGHGGGVADLVKLTRPKH